MDGPMEAQRAVARWPEGPALSPEAFERKTSLEESHREARGRLGEPLQPRDRRWAADEREGGLSRRDC